MLTQENLDRMHTDDMKLSLVLFDEIEKASDSLWQLLLGILDKATLTLGDNRRVDFSKCMVIMTSNLGAREMSELISGGIGFAPGKGAKNPNDTEVDQKIYRTAVEAARRKFSPEFMNRIDKVVVFRSLKEHHLRADSRSRIAGGSGSHHAIGRNQVCLPVFRPKRRTCCLKEGLDFKYGARHLKRAVERFLVYPLSNLVATGQIGLGDLVHVGLNSRYKTAGLLERVGRCVDYRHRRKRRLRRSSLAARSGSVGLPIPQVKETKAAKKGQGRGERAEG